MSLEFFPKAWVSAPQVGPRRKFNAVIDDTASNVITIVESVTLRSNIGTVESFNLYFAISWSVPTEDRNALTESINLKFIELQQRLNNQNVRLVIADNVSGFRLFFLNRKDLEIIGSHINPRNPRFLKNAANELSPVTVQRRSYNNSHISGVRARNTVGRVIVTARRRESRPHMPGQDGFVIVHDRQREYANTSRYVAHLADHISGTMLLQHAGNYVWRCTDPYGDSSSFITDALYLHRNSSMSGWRTSYPSNLGSSQLYSLGWLGWGASGTAPAATNAIVSGVQSTATMFLFRLRTAAIYDGHRFDEDHNENTMATLPHATAKRSEKSLRVRLRLPVVNYAVSCKANALKRAEFFANTNNYLAEENRLIAAFVTELKIVQATMIIAEILILEKGKYILKNDDQSLVTALATHATSNWTTEQFTRAEQAMHAFNVAAALRALDPASNSRYVTNDPYTLGTMILPGYGLRNVLALLYASINSTLCVGVTRQDALQALIKGIVEGFRGKNRNNKHGLDDFSTCDHPSCGKGNYNAMIAALMGVVPGVEILFDLEEVLLAFFKRKIIEGIVESTNDTNEAVQYLQFWTVADPEDAEHPFFAFRNRLCGKVEIFCYEFLEELDCGDAEIREALQNAIKATVEQKSCDSSILATISPTEKSLREYDASKRQQGPRLTLR